MYLLSVLQQRGLMQQEKKTVGCSQRMNGARKTWTWKVIIQSSWHRNNTIQMPMKPYDSLSCMFIRKKKERRLSKRQCRQGKAMWNNFFGLPGRETPELLNAAPHRLLSGVWGLELAWRSPHLTAERAATRERGTIQATLHHPIKTRVFDPLLLAFINVLSSKLEALAEPYGEQSQHLWQEERGKSKIQRTQAFKCFAKQCTFPGS